MNIKIHKQIVDLFDSLPNFEHYGYYNESIKDVGLDDDGNIKEILCQSGV